MPKVKQPAGGGVHPVIDSPTAAPLPIANHFASTQRMLACVWNSEGEAAANGDWHESGDEPTLATVKRPVSRQAHDDGRPLRKFVGFEGRRRA